jgi:hypothetical protein
MFYVRPSELKLKLARFQVTWTEGSGLCVKGGGRQLSAAGSVLASSFRAVSKLSPFFPIDFSFINGKLSFVPSS